MRQPRPARWLIGLALLAATAALAEPTPAPPAADDAGVARVRLLHAVPSDPAVTVYIDGVAQPEPLRLGDLTEFQPVPAGRRNFKALTDDAATLLDDRDADLAAGADYTIALVRLGDGPQLVRMREYRLPEPGRVAVRAAHLADEAPTVDWLTDGEAPLAQLNFGQVVRPVPFDPGPRTFRFRDANGRTLASTQPIELQPDTAVLLFLVPNPDRRAVEPFRVLVDVQPVEQAGTAPEAPPAAPPVEAPALQPPPQDARQSGLASLRVVHGLRTTEPLSATLDQRPLIRDLGFGQAAAPVPVAAGHHRLALSAPATATLRDDLLAFDPGQRYTVLLTGAPAEALVWVLRDDPPPPEAGTHLRLVHAAPALGPVDLLLDGQVFAGELPVHSYTAYQPVPVTAAPVRLHVRRSGQSPLLHTALAQLVPGAAYTLLVLQPADEAVPAHLTLLRDA